jgi:tRNA(Arg) A34 adenosine deaminase TadA
MKHPSIDMMQLAINQALLSAAEGQYPLASVLVLREELIAVAKTTLHITNDPTAHAEINAIREACQKQQSRFLEGAWLYTTHEPCAMCAAAAIWAKMEGIVYGASIQDAVAAAKKLNKPHFSWRQITIPAKEVLSHGTPQLKLIENFMRDECIKLFTVTP